VNDHLFCFIACVNNDEYENELLKFLSYLKIPEGYEIDYISVRDAKSMCAGYNEGMNASDAKYKIYLHQDTFIVNDCILFDLLDIFEDSSIGMVGLVGSPVLPDDCIMWDGDRVGKVYYSTYYRAGINLVGESDAFLCDVEAIDGFLMATQVDLPWREDIFDRFDFYDISMSAEMRRAGYRVVVPKQLTPWCLHDDAFMNLVNYEKSRKVFIKEYLSSASNSEKFAIADKRAMDEAEIRNEWERLYGGERFRNRIEEINLLINKHSEEAYRMILDLVNNEEWFTPVRETDEFAALYIACSVYSEEKKAELNEHIFSNASSVSDIKRLLFEIRTILYELEFISESTEERFLDFWNEYSSIHLVWRCIFNMIPHPLRVSYLIYKIFNKANFKTEACRMLIFMDSLLPNNLYILLELADVLNKIDTSSAQKYLSDVPDEFWSLKPDEQSMRINTAINQIINS